MEKKFTFFKRLLLPTCLVIVLLSVASLTTVTYSQMSCPNSTILFSEDFGSGTTSTSSPDIIPGGLDFQATGSLVAEGVYRIINSTHQKPEWHIASDH
ncbi:MAG: hypothetical protein ABIO82_05590, partial [Ginsengibacter sp.]